MSLTAQQSLDKYGYIVAGCRGETRWPAGSVRPNVEPNQPDVPPGTSLVVVGEISEADARKWYEASGLSTARLASFKRFYAVVAE